MKIYSVNIQNQKSEELEHRLSYLKRNHKMVDSLGNVEISFRHHQEELIINEELLRRSKIGA